MKRKCILFFVFLSFSNLSYGQSFLDMLTAHSWKGSGTLMNAPASFEMHWQWTLDSHFLKLEFQNKRSSKNGDEIIFKAHAYYKLENDSLLTGTWFDSRGINFPLSAKMTDTNLTVEWGAEAIEQGKTVYALKLPGELKVTDFILQDGEYVKFGEASYRKAKQKNAKTMKRVTGVGGIFFKSDNPQNLKEWYNKYLGLKTDQWGTNFEWRQADDNTKKGFTQWSPFIESTTYFEPSEKDFMLNYRVENLAWLVDQLKKEGVTVLDEIETFEYGKFVHIMDPEGNKIELWEPDDVEYDKIVEGRTK